MKKCNKCGTVNSKDAIFCENCGTKLDESLLTEKKKECKNCRYLNEENAAFCENCGSSLNENQQKDFEDVSIEDKQAEESKIPSKVSSTKQTDRRSRKNTEIKMALIFVAIIVVIVAIMGFVYLKGNKYIQFIENNDRTTLKKNSSSSKESSSANSKKRSNSAKLSEETYNAKKNQQNIDVTNLTVPQCLLWALSERYSGQNADEQSWDKIKDSIDSAEVIPATKSNDNYVHIYFKYGSEDCNYYIDGNYDLCSEDGEIVSRYPTEFENKKANNYIMNRY
ncbi:zinc ribbon domain-containing protein [Ligilactobacillus salivarius]|uniref:zinc ribbon domain-containing protein n=1 Tax=Ligilactobacillus salivarius TaxID=1624 RepID=UPI001CDAB54D|nr:zinc ribbon domain-containing protein [Ligilactobacillus salivarius]MDY2638702.1 zinc ribbon domain-containing protein [Ligilactobacillus salivarius]